MLTMTPRPARASAGGPPGCRGTCRAGWCRRWQEVVDGLVEEPRFDLDGRVVDQHVDPAGRCRGRRPRSPPTRASSPTSPTNQPTGPAGPSIAPAVASVRAGSRPTMNTRAPSRRVGLGDRPTDAATAAGHDRDPIIQPAHRRAPRPSRRPGRCHPGFTSATRSTPSKAMNRISVSRLRLAPSVRARPAAMTSSRRGGCAVQASRAAAYSPANPVHAPQPGHREDRRIERHRETGPGRRVGDSQPAGRQPVDEGELPRRRVGRARHRQVDRSARARAGAARRIAFPVPCPGRGGPRGTSPSAPGPGSGAPGRMASPGWIPHMNGIGFGPDVGQAMASSGRTTRRRGAPSGGRSGAA